MAFVKIVSFVASVFLFLHALARDNSPISRKYFPSKFVFGVTSSAYQYEGGYLEGGRGLSNWDVFSHTPVIIAIAGNIADGSNADVAVDEYHRYKEHVEIMAEMAVDVYRFSIAWSRIYPEGNGEINPNAVKYYNDLIDELLSKGIQPFMTLLHYDSPQALEDQYGSWLNPRIADDFARYAETCYRMFGDRVKHWATFNEPNEFAVKGYDTGEFAPGRCSVPFGNCRAGNSSTEPYIVAHNVLRAHALAVDVYRKRFQARQGGFIGIVIPTPWFEPFRNVPEDLEAAHRILAFRNACWCLQLPKSRTLESMLKGLWCENCIKIAVRNINQISASHCH